MNGPREVSLNPLEQEAVRQFRSYVQVEHMSPGDMAEILTAMRHDFRSRKLVVDFCPAAVLAVLYPDSLWADMQVVLAPGGRNLRPPG